MKVVLVLVVVGYCVVLVVVVNGNLKLGQWQIVFEQMGIIQGMVLWIICVVDKIVDIDKDYVMVIIDCGDCKIVIEGDKQFYVGDKVMVNWVIGDMEGDLDIDNMVIKVIVKWVSFSDQNGSDFKDFGIGDSYEIQVVDVDCYIGIKIMLIIIIGDFVVVIELLLKDLLIDVGGGLDDDEILEGLVVDENVYVVIYEKDLNINLLKNIGMIFKMNIIYQVLLWSDKNGNGIYDVGENVIDQYDYCWKFVGISKIVGIGIGGIVNESWNDKDFVIFVINVEVKMVFEGVDGGVIVGSDGVQGFGLFIDYKCK